MTKLSSFCQIGCCLSVFGLMGCQPSTPRAQENNGSQVSAASTKVVVPKANASQPKPVVDLSVAAASNLQSVLPILVSDFARAHSDIRINVHYDSSVDLYDQIVGNKQKFDIFLSGNQILPKLAYEQGHASKAAKSTYGKPFTYTRGQLVLYSTKHPLDVTPTTTLDNFMLDHNGQITLAIANPQVATYGIAAEDWLVNQNLYQSIEPNVIYHKSVEDVFNATDKGKVDFGLVGLSQILAKPNSNRLSSINQTDNYSILPKDSYPPILQDGLVMDETAASEQFVDYLLTTRAQDIFSDAGYLPICTKSNLLPACK